MEVSVKAATDNKRKKRESLENTAMDSSSGNQKGSLPPGSGNNSAANSELTMSSSGKGKSVDSSGNIIDRGSVDSTSSIVSGMSGSSMGGSLKIKGNKRPSDGTLSTMSDSPGRLARAASTNAGFSHKYTPYSEFYPSLCDVCDKAVWSWYKPGSKCESCGMCVHDACAVFADNMCKDNANTTADSHANLSSESSRNMQPAAFQKRSFRHLRLPSEEAFEPGKELITRSSIYFIKKRLKMEAENPGLRDELYQKAVKNYIGEFLHDAHKFVKDRSYCVQDFETVFLETLASEFANNADEYALQQSASARMDAFKEALHHYIFYSNLTVDLSTIQPQDVAVQLTLIDSELFGKIEEDECKGNAWTKKDKNEKAKNIMAFINRFNQLTQWTMCKVLESPSAKERAATIMHFIAIAQHLRELNNFNAVKAIVAGLQSAPIHRLKKTWPLISSKYKNIYDKLANLMSLDNNAEVYRETLHSSSLPCIPFVGIWFTDLTYLSAAFSKQPEVLKAKTQEIIDQIKYFQEHKYVMQPIFALKSYLSSLRFKDEDYCFKLSLKREPRQESSVPKKASTFDLKAGCSLSIGPNPRTWDMSEFDHASIDDCMVAITSAEKCLEALQKEISSFYSETSLKHTFGKSPKKPSKAIEDKTQEMWDIQMKVTQVKRRMKKLQHELAETASMGSADESTSSAPAPTSKSTQFSSPVRPRPSVPPKPVRSSSSEVQMPMTPSASETDSMNSSRESVANKLTGGKAGLGKVAASGSNETPMKRSQPIVTPRPRSRTFEGVTPVVPKQSASAGTSKAAGSDGKREELGRGMDDMRRPSIQETEGALSAAKGVTFLTDDLDNVSLTGDTLLGDQELTKEIAEICARMKIREDHINLQVDNADPCGAVDEVKKLYSEQQYDLELLKEYCDENCDQFKAAETAMTALGQKLSVYMNMHKKARSSSTDQQ